jgi:glycosyltransferase involved in cell wall biosynthesis
MWPRGPEKDLLDCFDVIVVPASCFADDLRAMNYRGRTVVLSYLPPPAAPYLPPPCSESGVIRLGYLGRFERQKNLEYMLEIFQRLSASTTDPFELHLFGDGSLWMDLEQKAASSPAAARIVFHGAVNGRAKWEAIDSCDLFLNTSWSEGQCLVALEVLGRGRPLLATPVGALPELIDSPELGALIPLNDPATAAKIVSGAAERWKSGELNPGTVRARFDGRFSREVVVAGYVRLFNEMMEHGAADSAIGA